MLKTWVVPRWRKNNEKAKNFIDPGFTLFMITLDCIRLHFITFIRRVFRSQLLDPERFQEPAPGSTWFSGVSSWIDRVFRSQFLDPERFQESIPGSKWFLGLNFPEKHHQKNVFFKILMNNFLFFSCLFLLFFVFVCMFFPILLRFCVCVFSFFNGIFLFFRCFWFIFCQSDPSRSDMYQKKHQTIPQMKVLYGLFLTTNDVENWKS